MVEVAKNGITIVASYPRDWYERNGQEHELNGKLYWVVLWNHELRTRQN